MDGVYSHQLPDTEKTRGWCQLYIFIFMSLGVRSAAPLLVRSGVSGLQVTYASDEKELFQEVTSIIRKYGLQLIINLFCSLSVYYFVL